GLNEIATDYVRLIREAQPKGPYVLMGHCVAGLIAYEAAQQLREAGESVPLVIMADSGTGYLPPVQRFLQRWHIRFLNQGHRMRLVRSGKEHLTDALVNPMLIGRLVDVAAKLGLVGDTTTAKANWGNRWFLPHLMKAQDRYQPTVSTENV